MELPARTLMRGRMEPTVLTSRGSRLLVEMGIRSGFALAPTRAQRTDRVSSSLQVAHRVTRSSSNLRSVGRNVAVSLLGIE